MEQQEKELELAVSQKETVDVNNGGVMEWTKEEELKMRWKLDRRIVPLSFLFYMLCFVDRTNIGNARISGMAEDLNLSGYRFNIALTVFYISYILVEIPSNMLLKIIGGRYYIPTLVFLFGTISVATAFVQNYAGLIACRFFLGLVEGGVAPAIVYYMSIFYRRTELAFRVTMFITGASMAGAFGGLLATALTLIPRWGASSAPLHTWRNIFFFEGLVTMLVASLGVCFLPDSPSTARFLSDRHRTIASRRIADEYKEESDESGKGVRARHVKKAVMSVSTNLSALMFFFLSVNLSSISLFLPTILRALGYSAVQAQLRSVAPYVSACVVSIFVSWCSDRFRRRGVFIASATLLGTAGYGVLIGTDTGQNAAKYAAVFVAAMGVFAAGPASVSWGVNNAAGASVRSVTSAYIISLGNCGSVVATWTYLPESAPRYTLGHALNLGALACAFLLAVSAVAYYRWENKKRDRGERDHRLTGLTDQQQKDLGSSHPEFRYIP
ncbi:hypothetical protein H2204_009577 [Knufia peltigerae]|uniref:Major facilitator superfamily (MFS) profile domain-containing protein n=1 Tax=Knufia peltigerae TaxID=1002370 RepID=A0AA39CTK5_9EURO|nr:hypothetical protein H2204_009577 [Knufia peltigerae]